VSFYDDVIKVSPNFDSPDICCDVTLLEPGTRLAVANLIALAAKSGRILRVKETHRSTARQFQMYEKGWSKLRHNGCHGWGLAVDFELYINGVKHEEDEAFNFMPPLCKTVGLISGGDWGTPRKKHNFQDWDHVQRIPIFRQNEVFAEKWYPPESYNPLQDMIVHKVEGV